jgi:thiol-disulfide isomerase/thioredoxin
MGNPLHMRYSVATMRMLVRLLGAALIVSLAAPVGSEPPADSDSAAELIGKPAPGWTFDRWIRTQPLSLEALRGKVVLLRWWTSGCHFCEATLPVLEQVRERGHDDLVVIGVYHPKPVRKVSDKHVLAVANRLGFKGPIAVDTKWRTLERYWLDGHPERSWTSVSFLIDKNGVIRWAHGGGEYHPSTDPRHARCALQYQDFERVLATVLAEKPQT